MNKVVVVIFKEGKSSNAKNLQPRLRIWAKILLGCIHHDSSGNSANYIISNQ